MKGDSWTRRGSTGGDQTLQILIRHCRDMKRQETRTRSLSLLMMLCCLLFIIFTSSGHLSSLMAPKTPVVPSPEKLENRTFCPSGSTDPAEKIPRRMSVHVRLENGQWQLIYGESFEPERQAIVIQNRGFYFVYVTATYACGRNETGRQAFRVGLQRWSPSYSKQVKMAYFSEALQCKSSFKHRHTMYIGQVFELLENDRVSVYIPDNNVTIIRSSFGAFTIS